MQNRHPIPPRRSATVDAHRAGHYSGIHPEDEPYVTAQRQRYPNNPLDLADDLDYPGEKTRMPTSAVRYVDTRGNQVIQRGNQRFVIQDEPPPRRRGRIHWSAIFGIGMTVMVLLFISWTLLNSWWTNHQMDAMYGMPRTWQCDAVVYAGDSADHPSHYIFLNLNGTIQIIEFPHGDSSKARIYKGPTLFSTNADQIPVTGEFKMMDGKEEMLVHIEDRTIVYVSDGTQFKPQQ
jgi:hypothetical protein